MRTTGLGGYRRSPTSSMPEVVFSSRAVRFGDYRLIFDLEEETIVVLRVGHRREIFR